MQRADEQLVDLPVLGGDPHGFLPDPGTAAGSMSFSHYSLSKNGFMRRSPGVRVRGCKRTRAHPRRRLSGRSQGVVYDVDYVECEGPSGTRLDSGTAGGWPLRTGPSWTRSYGGPRGLSVGGGGCEGRSGDIMHLELQQFFLFMFLGGPPNSVQFQSTDVPVACFWERLWWSTFL